MPMQILLWLAPGKQRAVQKKGVRKVDGGNFKGW